MAHQVNIFLLSLGAIQGILLSLYFLRNRKSQLANTYFILIMTLAGLQLTFKVMSKSWLMTYVQLPYIMSYCLPYLAGPLLYLYMKAKFDNTFRKFDLLHFTPFIISMSIAIIQFYYRYEFRVPGETPYGRALTQFVILGVYSFLSWKIILKEKQLQQLKAFLIGLFCSESIIIVTLALMYVYYGRFPDVRLLFITLTIFIYWISYKQLQQPNLFLAYENLPDSIRLQIQGRTKYNNSGLRESDAIRISTLLKNTVQDQKVFLYPDLTIDQLAKKLNVSRHHISQVLNERFNVSYNDYINEHRLAEARLRLQSPKYKFYTISAIAMDSGFNSVSTFNELFKKKFRQTPSQCRSQSAGKMTA